MMITLVLALAHLQRPPRSAQKPSKPGLFQSLFVVFICRRPECMEKHQRWWLLPDAGAAEEGRG